MTLRSAEGWIYYHLSGLTITPLGDIWFKRLDVEGFLRGFEKDKDGKILTTQTNGIKTVLDLQTGYFWSSVQHSIDTEGIFFYKGVLETSERISLNTWMSTRGEKQ